MSLYWCSVGYLQPIVGRRWTSCLATPQYPLGGCSGADKGLGLRPPAACLRSATHSQRIATGSAPPGFYSVRWPEGILSHILLPHHSRRWVCWGALYHQNWGLLRTHGCSLHRQQGKYWYSFRHLYKLTIVQLVLNWTVGDVSLLQYPCNFEIYEGMSLDPCSYCEIYFWLVPRNNLIKHVKRVTRHPVYWFSFL